jgi:oligopeptide/dipeptide ABC transporter ATP-binding protein
LIMEQQLLSIENLKVYYQTNGKKLWAVNDISIHLNNGDSLGLVGESGSGKSTVCLAIMRLLEGEGGASQGRIIFQGSDLLKISENAIRDIRGKSIAMIFQEPSISLNPVLSIEEQISEVMRQHLNLNKREARKEVIELLKKVHISSPEQRLRSYPHQLSGGMQQRVMIAMAISCKPALLIADEPTSALDSSIEAQIIDLMIEIKEKYQLSLLLVSHNLNLVAQLANRIAIIYAGTIVEHADTEEIFTNPKHPYTAALLKLLPSQEETRLSSLPIIAGMMPALINLPAGCPFHPRCPEKIPQCSLEIPAETKIKANHYVRCFKIT